MPDSEENKPTPQYFTCLPYINLGDIPEVDLGFAKIWNFDLSKEKYIPDQALREHIEIIMKNYKQSYPYGEREEPYLPIKGIGFINIGIPSGHRPSKSENEKINDARLLIFISFLARNNTLTRNANTGHRMATSENYAPLYFSAVVGSKYMTENVGFAVPSWHGGILIDKNTFISPKYIPRPNFSIDEDLLKSLIELRSKHKRFFRRIVSAVEVFYESYYNAPEVSHNARILLQASAFEILFNTESGKIREKIKLFFRKVADYPEDKRLTFESERGGKIVKETGTIREKWADSFFTLRNHIIHGEIPKEREYFFGKWQRHFDIALYFFIFCLKRKIEEGLDKELFGDEVVWKNWIDKLSIPVKRYIGFEYDGFGRRYWERMRPKLPTGKP